MAETLRILYVDDEPGLLGIGKRFLEKGGAFTVDTLTSAIVALERLKTERYDAIISDYQMPEMDGIAFLKQLKASGDSTPFIIFTGRGREEVVIEALNEGADFYLQKGGELKSQFTELAHKIRSAVMMRQTLQTLAEQDQRYHDLQNANDLIQSFAPDGHFLFVNKKWLDTLGYEEHELPALTIFDIIHEESLGHCREVFQRINSGENIGIIDAVFRTRDGRRIDVEGISNCRMVGGKPQFTRGIFKDVTNLKRAEKDLQRAYEEIAASEEELRAQLGALKEHAAIIRASEEKFSETTNNIPGVVFQFKVKPDKSRTLPYVSDRVRDIMGVEDIRNDMFEYLSTRIHPDDKVEFFESVDEAVRSKSRWRSEFRFLKPSGELIWLQGVASPVEHEDELIFSGVFIDISDRKQRDEALRESERRYRTLVDISPDAVLIHQDGKIVYMNPAGLALLGATHSEDVMCREVFDFICPDFRDTVRMNIERDLNGEMSPLNELSMRRLDGSIIEVEGRGVKTSYKGRPAVQVAIRDITGRREEECLIRESEDKFRTVFENSPYPISINSIPDGKFIAVNAAFLRSSGYMEADVLGTNPVELGMLSILDSGRLTSRFLLTGRIEHVPMVLVGKGGAKVHVQFSCIPITIHERPAIMTIAAVITKLNGVEEELFKKNEELLASEENFRKIFENNALGMALVLPDLRFVLVNPAFIAMIGYSEEEFRTMSFKDITHPAHLAGDIEGIRALEAGSIPVYSSEKRYIRKDGSVLWGAVKVTVIRNYDATLRYYLAQIEDISSRQRALELLQESENKFTSVFHGSPVSLTLVSAIDGTFVNVNDAFLRATGYSRDEVIGVTSEALGIFADDIEREQLTISLRERHVVEDIEIKCRIKTGEIRSCLFSSGIIMIGSTPHILSTVRDNTRQKEAEEALKASEEKFREIFNSANDGIHLHESDKNCAPGRYVDVNETVCRMLQYTKEELLQKRPVDISTPSRNPPEEQILRELRQTGHVVFETGHRRKDGTIVPVEINAHIVTIGGRRLTLSIARDITERKRAGELLRESEERFRILLQHVPALAVQGYALDGTTQYWNEASELMYGYSQDEAIGRNLLDLIIPPEMRNEVKESMRSMEQTGQPIPSAELCLMRKDGSRISVYSSHAIVTRPGYPTELFCIDVDLSERRKMEEALRESEEKFRLISENSPDHIIIQDLDLRYTYVLNPQLGFSKEEMLGKTDDDFLSIEDARKLTLIKRQVLLTGKVIPYETFLLSKKGEREYFEGAFLPKYDKEGRIDGLMGYFRNITGRKREEERLSEVNSAFLKFGPDPVDNINILTGLAGKMLQGSCALYNRLEGGMLCSLGMWGTPPDYATRDLPEGHICYDVIRDTVTSPRIISNLLETPYAETDPNVRLYQLQTYIGIPVEIGGRSLGSLCVVYQHSFSPSTQDLEILSFIAKAVAIEDERRIVNLSLLESEAKHRVLIEEASDPLFMLTSEGRYTYANQALADAFGTPVEEIIGKGIQDFFPEEEADKRIAALKQVFSSGEKNVVEGPVQAKAGDRYYLTTITPVKDPSDRVISVICTSIDITERKKTEEALQQSEESYRGLFNTIRQAMYILDDQGKFIDVNEGAEKMYGYARHEFIGKTPEFISAPGKNDFAAVMRQLGMAYAGEPQQFEFWGRRKNTEIFLKDVRLYKGTYFGRDVIVGIGTDITERRNSEVAFQAMVTSMVGSTGMDSLRKITENVGSWLIADCVMIGEIQPDQQTVKVISMLLDGKQVLDYSYTLEGTPCENVAEKGFCLYPDDVISLFPDSRDLVELQIRGYLGTPLRNSEGEVMGILCALFRRPVMATPGMREIIDIIAVKASAEIEGMRMMAALRESEEDYSQVMNGVATLISYMDTQLRFVLVNKAYQDWHVCTEEDLVGKRLEDLLPRDEFLRVLPYYQQVLDGHDVVFENPSKDKDGRERVLSVRMVPHIHDRQVEGIFATHEDITERRRAEEALRQANKKLTLLSGITRHDINNQLTVLMGYLSMLKKKEMDTATSGYFQKISTAAERIAAMIRFTKEYESIGVLAPAWQNARTLVDTASGQAPLGKVVVKNDLPKGLEVFADPLIVKVCYNLMDNAVRYGGNITTIHFLVNESDGNHIIVCEDDGIGIPTDEKEKIFDRGYGKNTGLGLALSREILSITGISIRETGEPGNGARFEMTVPNTIWRMTGNGT